MKNDDEKIENEEEIEEKFEDDEDFDWVEDFEKDEEEEQRKKAFRQKCKDYGIAAAVYVGFLLLFFSQEQFVMMDSPSIPYRLCLQIFHLKPQKGDLCVFEKRGHTLVKYIAAVPGDDISNVMDDLYINGEKVCKAERTATLTPVQSFFVPGGRVFVLGTHENSLDSRYEEFGLVNISDIRGTAIGLWKW
jgi:signal peptidase I